MRILVTGATGFIGCKLAQFLAGSGHDLIATGRAATELGLRRLSNLRQSGIGVQAGSLLDPRFVAEIVLKCDAIVHLAAAQHESNVPDSYFHDVNVVGTQRLIDAAVDAGVRRFVYGSTIGVYGCATGGELDEDSPPRPENIYTRTKLAAERVVADYSSRIEVCIARISETYGPGDLRLLKLFRAIGQGKFVLLGSGMNLRQVIYVDDLIAALLLALEHPAANGQTFVFAGCEVMTTNEMVAHIASALGRRPTRLRMPVWPFRAVAAVLEATLRPLGIQPPLTQRRLDFFTKSFLFSISRSRHLLGFTPQVAFRAGVAKTAEWYKQAGYL
jgi:nucleoside-diphosphate-sugar epimerase